MKLVFKQEIFYHLNIMSKAISLLISLVIVCAAFEACLTKKQRLFAKTKSEAEFLGKIGRGLKRANRWYTKGYAKVHPQED